MNSGFGMQNSELLVDNAAHRLHFRGHDFPCDREIEAAALWQEHALLLSSDTDCLSLWDAEGLVRMCRVGVYPQDMAVWEDTVVVCGGADGHIHLLALPELRPVVEFTVPGMPERVSIHGESICLLTLLADTDVYTALLTLDLRSGKYAELARYAGLPGAILADRSGIWVGVSELVVHFPWGQTQPDTVIEGFGLVRQILAEENALLVSDPLEGLLARITRKPQSAVEVLYRGEIDHIIMG